MNKVSDGTLLAHLVVSIEKCYRHLRIDLTMSLIRNLYTKTLRKALYLYHTLDIQDPR